MVKVQRQIFNAYSAREYILNNNKKYVMQKPRNNVTNNRRNDFSLLPEMFGECDRDEQNSLLLEMRLHVFQFYKRVL